MGYLFEDIQKYGKERLEIETREVHAADVRDRDRKAFAMGGVFYSLSVPALIAKLSEVLPLLPGDVIYTGTPAGVGLGRHPERWLAPGDELVSTIEGIGELRQRFVS